VGTATVAVAGVAADALRPPSMKRPRSGMTTTSHSEK
jgi:hypothetical protein